MQPLPKTTTLTGRTSSLTRSVVRPLLVSCCTRLVNQLSWASGHVRGWGLTPIIMWELEVELSHNILEVVNFLVQAKVYR